MENKSLRKEGFTLIELMVVVAIIALLATLIVPTLQSAQQAALSRKCMSTARSIAGSVIAYASNWDGFAPSERSYYCKLFGYRLTQDPGYFGEPAGTWYDIENLTNSESQKHQAKIDDYICPVASSAALTEQGFPSSYTVTSSYVAKNIMANPTESNRLLCVLEQGDRHSNGKGSLEGHLVFGDLHASLGIPGPLPGMNFRMWSGTSADWNLLITDNVSGELMIEDIWSDAIQDFGMQWLPRLGTTGIGKKIGGQIPSSGPDIGANFMLRWDGYISPHITGDYQINLDVDDRFWFWIDINENEQVDGTEFVQRFCCVRTENQPTIFKGLDASKKYKCAAAFWQGPPTGYYFHLRWFRVDTNGAPLEGAHTIPANVFTVN